MYFESRSDAGRQLACALVEKYKGRDCAIVGLSDGGVMVAEAVAEKLDSVLMMMLIEDIQVPGESISFGGVSQSGNFTYNGMFSAGEVDEYTSEFHGYLDEQKREAFQKINRMKGSEGVIDNELLRDKIVILVADGISTGAEVDVALDFLKPIRVKKIVFATAVASIPAVDRLHTSVDELHILSVKENFMGVDHYFENNFIPEHDVTIQKVNDIVSRWQ